MQDQQRHLRQEWCDYGEPPVDDNLDQLEEVGNGAEQADDKPEADDDCGEDALPE